MGTLLLVRHRALDELRVVKILRPDHKGNTELRKRFVGEAKAALKLRHDNVATIHDLILNQKNEAFIIMEFIDGKTLSEVLQTSGPPGLLLALEIATQTLHAIAYLHRKSFVHRDIAPDNVMLTRDADGKALVKVIDFGIVKAPSADIKTKTGMFLGKVRYSAPEQFKVRAPGRKLDPRSDLYSFGILFYQLLTGRYPIWGEDFASLMAGHLTHEPLAFDKSDPHGHVPDAVRQIVTRALEKDPDRRWQSADGLAQALEKAKLSLSGPDSKSIDVEAARILSKSSQGPSQPEPGTSTVESLLAKAEDFLKTEQFEQAKAILVEVLRIDPTNRTAQMRLVSVEVSLRRAREQRKIETEQKKRIERRLGEARRLTDTEAYRAALQVLEEVLTLDPANEEAVKLRATAESGLERQTLERARAKALSMATREIEELLEQRRPATASERLQTARASLPETGFKDLESRIKDVMSRAGKLETEARLLKSRKDYEGAHEKLLQSLDLDSENEKTRALLDSVVRTLKTQRQEEQRKQEQVRAHLDRGRQKIASGEFKAAQREVKQVLEIDSDHEEGQRLLQEVATALERKEQEDRRAREIAQATKAVEKLLTAARPSEALKRLQAASQDRHQDLTDLHAKVKRRIEEARSLIAQAQDSIEKRSFSQARQKLLEAQQIDRDDQETSRLLGVVKELQREEAEAQRKALDVAKRAAEVEKLIDAGKLEEARKKLDRGVALHGHQEAFEALRSRVENEDVLKGEAQPTREGRADSRKRFRQSPRVVGSALLILVVVAVTAFLWLRILTKNDTAPPQKIALEKPALEPAQREGIQDSSQEGDRFSDSENPEGTTGDEDTRDDQEPNGSSREDEDEGSEPQSEPAGDEKGSQESSNVDETDREQKTEESKTEDDGGGTVVSIEGPVPGEAPPPPAPEEEQKPEAEEFVDDVGLTGEADDEGLVEDEDPPVPSEAEDEASGPPQEESGGIDNRDETTGGKAISQATSSPDQEVQRGDFVDPCPGKTKFQNCTPPVEEYTPEPEYPAHLSRAGMRKVELILRINEHGRAEIEAYGVLAGDDSGELRELIEDAVRSWRFKPAHVNGVPVRTRYQKILMFRAGNR